MFSSDSNNGLRLGSAMTSALQFFMIAFAHSVTTTCTSPDKCRRDTGDGALKPDEILAFVGTILGFLVGIPGLIMVFIHARKYWRRRTKRVTIENHNNKPADYGM